jgi:hypothetical protein
VAVRAEILEELAADLGGLHGWQVGDLLGGATFGEP